MAPELALPSLPSDCGRARGRGRIAIRTLGGRGGGVFAAYGSVTLLDGARALSRRCGEDIDRRLLPEPLGGLVGLVADPRTLVFVAVPICPDGTLAGLDDGCRRDLLV